MTVLWLRGMWRETPRGLRVLWPALWGAGVLLLGLGWWGDQAGFWSSKPFVTNVFSSLTAAFFGIPLALIVLQRLGVAQAEAVEARAARRLAATVAEDLASAAPRLHPGPLSELRRAEAELLKVERAAQEAIRQWDSTQDEESLRPLRELLADGTLDGALADFRSAIRPGRQAIPAVAEVSAHWSFLNTTVRSRLLETGGTWLAAPLAARIDGMVKLVTADPYLDGWLRDLDMAIRRFHAASDLSTALRHLWTQLEIGSELAEAVGQLDVLTAQASRALTPSSEA
ncbi:hypothetical protein [Amycolatopsis vastitatis]|uniref:Uncharacterized protein n=1 Tax=Amycolatopsis vastitatis TaxID=1905142 RepID=A0A229T2J0_9PSEU|nr:hypothetical protein [Amycolatopsis vastitatis]OXM64979.1 hypothetical protein CF165_25040 [Amycolatopsis vastitatis]